MITEVQLFFFSLNQHPENIKKKDDRRVKRWYEDTKGWMYEI